MQVDVHTFCKDDIFGVQEIANGDKERKYRVKALTPVTVYYINLYKVD